jgi:hypothetical protein
MRQFANQRLLSFGLNAGHWFFTSLVNVMVLAASEGSLLQCSKCFGAIAPPDCISNATASTLITNSDQACP